MTARRQFADPVDHGGEAYPLVLRDETASQRDRARLKAADLADNADDLATVLAALGLDDPAEIQQQLQHRRDPHPAA